MQLLLLSREGRARFFFFLRNKLVEKRANLFCGSASLKISKYQGTKVHSKTQKGG